MTPNELLRNLEAIKARIHDPRPALRAILDLMVASADKNFEAEGRPNSWVKVRPATRRRKEAAGKSRILMWTGNLARRLDAAIQGQKAILGSNADYARIHNKGGDIPGKAKSGIVRLRTDAKGNLLRQGANGRLAVFAAKGHKRAVERAFTHGAYTIHMPARPFLIFQPGEPEQYGALVMHYFQTGRIEVQS